MAGERAGNNMRRVWKKTGLVLAAVALSVTLAACGNKEGEGQESTPAGTQQTTEVQISQAPTVSPTPTAAPTPTMTPTPTPDPHIGEVRSDLTGEWIPEEEAAKRPYAVVLNNLKLASPQSGIGEADILYEALVEGGITRFLGIYDGIETDRLGSIRSARHYFVSFADEYDAIFVHYGKTTYATKKINACGIADIDGTAGSGSTTFYRDKSIQAPHNAFTGKEWIEETVARLKFRTEHEESYEAHFQFAEESEADGAAEEDTRLTADKVTLGFSSYTSPYFEYHEDDGLYYRFQFGKEHMDYNTGEQLTFRNLIVQFVKEWDIDKNGYQTMELDDASGEGYFVTDGFAEKITWKKIGTDGVTRYYGEDGEEILLNPGKTYIAVFPNSRTAKVVIEEVK